jgi:hypothetical protein
MSSVRDKLSGVDHSSTIAIAITSTTLASYAFRLRTGQQTTSICAPRMRRTHPRTRRQANWIEHLLVT